MSLSQIHAVTSRARPAVSQILIYQDVFSTDILFSIFQIKRFVC